MTTLLNFTDCPDNLWPALHPQQVHIWQADLSNTQKLSYYQQLLSADEQQRAEKFVQVLHRERFIMARGILRCLLAHYLQQVPQQLIFEYGEHGKPILAFPHTSLNFNLSHSEHYALYAVSVSNLVGVDIEALCERVDLDGIAKRYFAAKEYAELQRLTAAEKLVGFFNAWTRKEAIVKVLGSGLYTELNKVIVSISPNLPSQIFHIEGVDAADWQLYSLNVTAGFVAALAVSNPVDVRCWYWRQ